MYGYVPETKVYATGVVAFLTAFWGLSGWLWVLWILCLAVDHLIGTVVACRRGEWSSKKSRSGIWGKLGSMLVVLVTVALDLVVGVAVNSYALPFTYTVLLSPIVLVWYILTELGSIFENADKLGARLPPFLVRSIAAMGKRVEGVGDAVASKVERED